MKAHGYLYAALLAAALSSCTVKEDRGPCPCVLDIYLEDSREHTERLAVSAWSEDERVFLDRIDTDQYPVTFQKKVPKGFLSVSACGGIGSMTLKGDRLSIPEGKQSDPVWAYSGEEIDATGESAEDHVVLHKQYAAIHVRLDSLALAAGNPVLRAVGNSDGLDIKTLQPTAGSFNCLAELDADLTYIFNVPRQYDDSLILEVYLDGALSRIVQIGELIANAGYSWTKEDLDDIYLSLGVMASGSAGISVNGWDEESLTFKL